MERFYKLSITQLLLILAFIIIVIPLLLTRDAFGSWFIYADKGQIGDTIGGITAPFINAIAAVLVFIAFKEQVKANDLIKEQQYFQHIQEQIHLFEKNQTELSEAISGINESLYRSGKLLNNFDNGKEISFFIDETSLKRILYITLTLHETWQLTKIQTYNKEILQTRLSLIYMLMYQSELSKVKATLQGKSKVKSKSKELVEIVIKSIELVNEAYKDHSLTYLNKVQ